MTELSVINKRNQLAEKVVDDVEALTSCVNEAIDVLDLAMSMMAGKKMNAVNDVVQKWREGLITHNEARVEITDILK